MHISIRDQDPTDTDPDPGPNPGNIVTKTVTPQLSVAFVGLIAYVIVLMACIGIQRFHKWKTASKQQATQQRPATETEEPSTIHMVYSQRTQDEPPPPYSEPPPTYIQEPEPAHVSQGRIQLFG